MVFKMRFLNKMLIIILSNKNKKISLNNSSWFNKNLKRYKKFIKAYNKANKYHQTGLKVISWDIIYI